jgi:hypothetical protein
VHNLEDVLVGSHGEGHEEGSVVHQIEKRIKGLHDVNCSVIVAGRWSPLLLTHDVFPKFCYKLLELLFELISQSVNQLVTK